MVIVMCALRASYFGVATVDDVSTEYLRYSEYSDDPLRRSAVSARSVLDRNFLVRARRELVAIQHVHRASRGIDPRFSDTERPGAENDGTRSILTRGRIVLREPLEHIARQLSQPFPDLR